MSWSIWLFFFFLRQLSLLQSHYQRGCCSEDNTSPWGQFWNTTRCNHSICEESSSWGPATNADPHHHSPNTHIYTPTSKSDRVSFILKHDGAFSEFFCMHPVLSHSCFASIELYKMQIVLSDSVSLSAPDRQLQMCWMSCVRQRKNNFTLITGILW